MNPRRRLLNVILGIVACAVLAPLGGPPVSGGDKQKEPATGEKAAEKRIPYSYACKWIKASEAQRILKELLEEPARLPGGRSSRNVFIAIDERTNTLHLRGTAQQITDAKAILAKIDIGRPARPPIIADAPILKVYRVASGTAVAVARTLQEAYKGSPGVRIANAGPDRVLVYALPQEQLEIARQVSPPEPEAPARRIESIPLTALEAAAAVKTLRELLGSSGATLVADTNRNAILVRGSKEQVDEVKTALKALGETGAVASGVRVFTVEGGDTAVLAWELQRILQEMRNNPVRVITPGRKPEQPAKPAVPGKAGPGAKKPAGKPVTLTAVGNKLLAASDDPQALALVQELVKVYNTPSRGNLAVLSLNRASAVEVARILDEVFNGRSAPGTTVPRQERVRIVADRASNALLVRATPLDVLTIRSLLSRTLDVPSEPAATVRTYFIGPLRHARANDAAKTLRELYRDGGKPSVAIAVDTRTNALILRGPAALYEEVRKLIERLDTPDQKKKEPEK
jgi:type II secretory pathway component GspD/PulD (secretin)